MAHFAKVDGATGNVINVIVAEQDFIDNLIDDIPGTWIKCSYNTRGGVHYEPNSDTPSADQSKALRKNFGSRDMEYDSVADAFHSPKPYPSWTLNSTTFLWEPPVEEPTATDDTEYVWNEADQSWDAVE
jgi:hypothetical protein